MNQQRRIGRAAYDALAAALPHLSARPVRLGFSAGQEPQRVRRVPVRRPSHASNATHR